MRRWLFFLMAVLTLWAFGVAAQSPSLVGQWTWGAGGGMTEIRADGTGNDARGNTLQWTVRNAADRTYVLRWSHGYTDTVTLSADGMSISGMNQTGFRFSATRAGGTKQPPVPGGGVAIAGEWDWVDGGVVVIRVDGTGRDSRGNTVQWTLRNSATRTYELRWSHGYTDTAILAADENSLACVNNQGRRFTATRRSVTKKHLDLNGSWSKGLLHIWHEGDQVLITATWKRDSGIWVSVRAEGRLEGKTMNLPVRYSANTNAVVGDLRGIFTVSDDGNTISAHYTLNSQSYDDRVYYRDQ